MEEVLQLNVVDFEVAADDYEDYFAIDGVEDGFQGFGLGNADEFGETLDGLDAGGGDFFKGQGAGLGLVGLHAGGAFQVGGEIHSRDTERSGPRRFRR